MKKISTLLFIGLVSLGLFGFSIPGFAHGYITSPGSRAYLGTSSSRKLKSKCRKSTMGTAKYRSYQKYIH